MNPTTFALSTTINHEGRLWCVAEKEDRILMGLSGASMILVDKITNEVTQRIKTKEDVNSFCVSSPGEILVLEYSMTIEAARWEGNACSIEASIRLDEAGCYCWKAVKLMASDEYAVATSYGVFTVAVNLQAKNITQRN